MRFLSSLVAGLVFGTGIAFSGMINPAKVLNFFDLAGTWDPSLAFVMVGALIPTFLGYKLVFGSKAKPVFDKQFVLPTARKIDVPLVVGSAVFGIGWGIAGFCPGGAIPALGLGDTRTFIFVAAMVTGLLVANYFKTITAQTARA